MTRTLQFGAIIAAIFITACALAYVLEAKQAYGSAGTLAATIATSTTETVGTTASTIVATSTCSARIISTYQQGVMLTFTDALGDTPSATNGHWQAASTTVAYDAALYGCGAVKAYAAASGSVKASDAR